MKAKRLVGVLALVAVLVALGIFLSLSGGSEWEALVAEFKELNLAGEHERASVVGRRAVVEAEKVFGHDHQNVAISAYQLADLYFTQGRFVDSVPLYTQVLSILADSDPADTTLLAESNRRLGTILFAQGHDGAEAHFRRALEIDEATLSPDHPDLASDLSNLGACHERRGDHGQAELIFERALKIHEKNLLLGLDFSSLESLRGMAELCRNGGGYSQAIAVYKRVLALCEQNKGRLHPDVAETLETLAELYRLTNRSEDARVLEDRATLIRGVQR